MFYFCSDRLVPVLFGSGSSIWNHFFAFLKVKNQKLIVKSSKSKFKSKKTNVKSQNLKVKSRKFKVKIKRWKWKEKIKNWKLKCKCFSSVWILLYQIIFFLHFYWPCSIRHFYYLIEFRFVTSDSKNPNKPSFVLFE